jgi:hypothetical protein
MAIETNLTRRQMLATSVALAASVAFFKEEKSEQYAYLLATVTGAEGVLPVGSYIPFDWSVGEINKNIENTDGTSRENREGVKLSWNPSLLDKKKSVRLRIRSKNGSFGQKNCGVGCAFRSLSAAF